MISLCISSFSILKVYQFLRFFLTFGIKFCKIIALMPIKSLFMFLIFGLIELTNQPIKFSNMSSANHLIQGLTKINSCSCILH